jgi:hypothetical protein
MKGYKVFKSDWTCRGFKYKVGKTYEIQEEPICCRRGFHFCEKLADCFNYYNFDTTNKIAEVEALGKINSKNDKVCTNKIKIVREISWYEALDMVNLGESNTGYRNIGYYNTGDFNEGNNNSGDYNSGNHNSGDYNHGDYNVGDCNHGGYNVGDCNHGNYNVGDCNHGDYNVGNWNLTNYANGCFNTEKPKIFLFNRLSSWTYSDFKYSSVYNLLRKMPHSAITWINFNGMSDIEKEEHPKATAFGGYTKMINHDEKDRQYWYDNLTEEEQEIIKTMPNFNAEIFKEITGITV